MGKHLIPMNTLLLRKSFLILAVISATGLTASADNITSTYIGPDFGTWSKPANWRPNVVPDNSGASTFNVTIDTKAVVLDIDVMINRLALPGEFPFLVAADHNLTSATTDFVAVGQLVVDASVGDTTANLGNLKAFSGTTLDDTAYLLAASAGAGRTATIQFNGANVVTNNGGPALVGPGTPRVVDENGNDAFRSFNHNAPLGFFQIEDTSFIVANSMTNEGSFVAFDGGTFTFAKSLTQIGDLRDPNDQQGGFLEVISSSASSPARIIIDGVLTNYNPATRTLSKGRYNLEATADGISTIQVLGGALLDIVHNDASITLNGPGSAILDKNGANALRNLAISHRFRLTNHDFTTLGSLDSSASEFAFLYVGGNTHFNVAGDLTMNAGSLVLSPLLDPADPTSDKMPSALTTTGGANLTALDRLRFDVFSDAADPLMTVGGVASLGGELQIFVLPSAPINSSTSLTLLTANSITGSFSNVSSGGRVLAYKPTNFAFTSLFNGVIKGTFKAEYSGTSLVISDFKPSSTIPNISTRVRVQPDTDGSAIAGFIIRGVAPKTVMLRGIGPSLASQGLAHLLQDPVIELHDSTGAVIAQNNNWQAKQRAKIEATGIAPTNIRESAIIATLEPGDYTAVLRGYRNGIGIALVEVYDLDEQPAGSEVANLSTRGFVGVDENVMIGGTIVSAGATADTIVRALGPSLAAHGVPGILQDPTLEIHDSNGAVIASDDNWADDAAQASAIQNVGLAPKGPNESAIKILLQPGSYTAVVRGKSDTTGIGLVEFYKLN